MALARRQAISLALMFAAANGCGSDETSTLPIGGGGIGGGGTGGASVGGGGTGGTLPEPICLQPGDGPYALTFTDVTDSMGLGPDALRMTGANVSIADIDGDHFPDLMLTRPTSVAESPHFRENPGAPRGIYHLFRNVGGAGFEDVTWSSGLFTARDGTPGRATRFIVWADVDNDGDVDALSAVFEDSASSPDLLDATTIYLNDGSGAFTIGPDQRFTAQSRDPLSAATFVDYDRNGVLDLWIGHDYATYGDFSSCVQDGLFAGDGLGGFLDVTTAAGLEQQAHSAVSAAAGTNRKPTWAVTACDVDGDGFPDLMTSSNGRQLNAFYRNLGDGTFEDLTLSSGFASDALEDYADNQFFRCYCVSHPTEPTCSAAEVPTISCAGIENAWVVGVDDQPWRLGGNSTGAVCGDVDGDGDLDLLALELSYWFRGDSCDRSELLRNDGFPSVPLSRPGNDVTGLDRPRAVDWIDGDLGGALADFDNDGRLDVLVTSSDYPATTSLLWQQQADGTFAEVGESTGARKVRAKGIGLLDFDRDGDLDVVLGTSLMRWTATDDPPAPDDYYAVLLRNDTGQDANKLMVHLVGSGLAGGANRDAIGARLSLESGGRTFVHEVQGGYGVNGIEHDRLVVLGLGAACSADSLTVRWPNATADEVTFTDVLANYVVVLEEGQGLVYQSLEEYAAP